MAGDALGARRNRPGSVRVRSAPGMGSRRGMTTHGGIPLPSLIPARDYNTLLQLVKALGDPWLDEDTVNVCRYCQSAWRHSDGCPWVSLAEYTGLETD